MAQETPERTREKSLGVVCEALHRILEYLRDERSICAKPGVLATGPNLVALLENVVGWALLLVSSCRDDDRVAEPRDQGQEIQAMSTLHRGFFHYIFVELSGAFVKWQLSGQVSDPDQFSRDQSGSDQSSAS